MKKVMLKLATGLFVLTLTTALNSCKKEIDKDDFANQYDMAMADENFNDVDNIADEAATQGEVSYKTDDANSLLSGCATVTRDTVSLPHVTTIDFGTGCTGVDGRTRKGKIIVTYDGPYRKASTTVTITFDNYFVNDNQVTGTKTIVNNGPNASGHLTFTVNVTGQVLLANNGGTISWTANRTREWIAGENTPQRDDDVFSITGSASGTCASGDQFTSNIITPLVRNLSPGCRRHFVSGVTEMQRTGKPTRTIDFGNGACDDQATVTVNGNTKTITLRK